MSCEATAFFCILVCGQLRLLKISPYHNIFLSLQSILSTVPQLVCLEFDDEGVFERVVLTHNALCSVCFTHTMGIALWLDMPRLTSASIGSTAMNTLKICSSARRLEIYFHRSHSTRFAKSKSSYPTGSIIDADCKNKEEYFTDQTHLQGTRENTFAL